MTSLATTERAAVVRALREAGPDAPTLCEGWTTRDLAAHLVVRERRPDTGPGILVPALRGWSERVRRSYAERPFEELLRLVETGPPALSPLALPGVGELVNGSEYFVHTEDVRRGADGWEPRDLPDDVQTTLWRSAVQRGGIMLRRAPVGVVAATPDGRSVTLHRGTPSVTVTGEPAELTLFLFGRGDHARVEITGDATAVQALRGTRLGL